MHYLFLYVLVILGLVYDECRERERESLIKYIECSEIVNTDWTISITISISPPGSGSHSNIHRGVAL